MEPFEHLSYLEERELIDDILTTLENEYGQSVERIARLNKSYDSFTMTLIFEDYMLLDAICTFTGNLDLTTIRIEGFYY